MSDFIIGIIVGVIISIFVTEIILIIVLIVKLVTQRKVLPEKKQTDVRSISDNTPLLPVAPPQEEEPSLLSSVFEKNFGGNIQ